MGQQLFLRKATSVKDLALALPEHQEQTPLVTINMKSEGAGQMPGRDRKFVPWLGDKKGLIEGYRELGVRGLKGWVETGPASERGRSVSCT